MTSKPLPLRSTPHLVTLQNKANGDFGTVFSDSHRAVCECGWHGAWQSTKTAAKRDGVHHGRQAA